MALVHRLGQRVGDAGAHPDHRRLVDPEPHRDRIGGLEADAADVAREPIRVLRHDLDGIGPVSLEDAHRARRAHAMAVQKDHDLAHDLLLGQALAMRSARSGPMPETSRRRWGSASVTSNTLSPNAFTSFVA